MLLLANLSEPLPECFPSKLYLLVQVLLYLVLKHLDVLLVYTVLDHLIKLVHLLVVLILSLLPLPIGKERGQFLLVLNAMLLLKVHQLVVRHLLQVLEQMLDLVVTQLL